MLISYNFKARSLALLDAGSLRVYQQFGVDVAIIHSKDAKLYHETSP